MTASPLLEVNELQKDFGIVLAVNGVSFQVDDTETKGLIGPNGAGKTTLLNCLSGILEPTSGRILFKGKDVMDDPPHAISHKGISRSFQITNLFEDFTVFENFRLASQVHLTNNLNFWDRYMKFEGPKQRAEEVLDILDLNDKGEEMVNTLSHGEKRLVELGIAITPDPDLLLLDEPTAGMAADDITTMKSVIQSLKADHAIVLVEHNVDFIMNLSDRILVLHQGELISEGTPKEIETDREVQEAYLGGEL